MFSLSIAPDELTLRDERDRQTERQIIGIDRQTERKTDIQTNGRTGRQDHYKVNIVMT